jgi:hypothetical protein
MWQLIAIVAASHLFASRSAHKAHAPAVNAAALKSRNSRLARWFALSACVLLLIFAGRDMTASVVDVVQVAAARVASGLVSIGSAAIPVTPAGAARHTPVIAARSVAAEPIIPAPLLPQASLANLAAFRLIIPPATHAVRTSLGTIEVRDLPSGGQQWRYPPNGAFDSVIASGEPLPEAEGLLAGPLFQTVFLLLGGGKEWVIQYCPARGESRPLQNGMIVTLPAPAKVDPPWPVIAELPPADTAAESGALFYAVLDQNGRLDGVRPAGRSASAGDADRFLPYLKRWLFRPAHRDGIPVEIELVMIAPAGGGA